MEKKKDKSLRKSSLDDGIPEAKYTRLGERIRQAIPGSMQCSVGCGGRNCKWENPSRWSDADQAIKGVFSSWVLDNVVAMSRPSTEIIKKYKMIEQFKKYNIRSIINLQQPGEHASCGPPLEKDSLFTYRPQEFMDNDIFFYNFGWKDYGVTSMSTILDMVKVMCFALDEGKVAVHCHAGLGRTGVLIACYLVYEERMDPASAIFKVRKKRSNSIQTRGQIACISEFWQYLKPLRVVFPQVFPLTKRFTLKQFLYRQRQLLHGYESRELRHIPKLIHVICERLKEIANADLKTENKEKLSPTVIKRSNSNTTSEVKETLSDTFLNRINQDLGENLNPVMKILNSAPTAADAVLSPRVKRRSSARSVSSLEAGNRPHSACDDYRAFAGEASVFETSVSETNEIHSVDDQTGNTQTTKVSSSKDSTAVSPPASAENNNKFIDTLEEITDEMLEKEVDEILGCNKNNNHSVKVAAAAVLKTATEVVTRTDNSPLFTTTSESNGLKLENHRISSGTVPKSAENRTLSQFDHNSIQPTSSAIKKPRHSAGKSDTILPTGLPSKNPRASAKDKRSLLSNNDETEQSKTETLASLDVSNDDVDLDEIIDIEDDGSLDDDTNSNDGLSQSIASCVSWSHKQPTDDDEQEQEFSASKTAQQGSRRTPLIYRVEKNLALLDDEQIDAEDGAGPSKIVENYETSDSSGNDDDDRQTSDNFDSSSNVVSNSNSDISIQKSHMSLPIKGRMNVTRSLNNLASLHQSESTVPVSRCSSTGDMRHPSPHERVNPTNVALAMSYKLIDDEWLWEKVYSLQCKVNTHKDAWQTIAETTDAYLLSSLMWSWVEHLSEPVLNAKDIQQLLSIIERSSPSSEPHLVTDKFEKALSSLDPSVSGTMKCLLSCVASFPSLPRLVTNSMVERIVSACTQTTIPPASKTETNNKEVRFFQEYINALYAVNKRSRYIDDKKEDDITIATTIIEPSSAADSSDSDYSVAEDDNDDDSDDITKTDVRNVAVKSASSVHSSGSSNAGNALLTTPRIIVN